MESTAIFNSYNFQSFGQPQQAQFNFNSPQHQSNKNISNTLYINEEYPVTNYNKPGSITSNTNNHKQ
jgi:hypothetical protein